MELSLYSRKFQCFIEHKNLQTFYKFLQTQAEVVLWIQIKWIYYKSWDTGENLTDICWHLNNGFCLPALTVQCCFVLHFGCTLIPNTKG